MTGGLVERDGVLDKLTAALDRASSGAGELVVIDAAGGMGKTTLLAAFVTLLAAGTHRVLSACGFEQERTFAFGVVRQLLERPLADQRTRRAVLVDAAEVVSFMFSGGEGPGSEVAPMQARHGLYWTIANLAHRRPLVILVDDAHEADEASLQFLAYLARRLADLPVLLVVATRAAPETDARPELADLRRAGTRLELRPLTEQAVATLVTRRVQAECAPAFARACHAGTGGNPFYLTELIQAIAGHGIAPDAANADRVAQLGPPAIVGSVLMRLASLAEGSPALARACAVLGDGASLRDCATLAELAPTTAATAADALTKAGIFAAGPSLRFAHAILRAAVLTEFGTHEQARWHGLAAQLHRAVGSPVHVVAGHLLRSAPSGDPETVAGLRTAAADAVRNGSPAEAIALLDRALAEPAGDDEGADLQFELGTAHAMLGSIAAIDHLRASVAGTADPFMRARRTLVLADVLIKAGASASAVAALDDALTDDVPDVELAIELRLERFWIAHLDLATTDLAGDGQPHLRAALDLPDGSLRRRAAAYLAMEAARIGSRDEALGMIEQATAPPGLLAVCPPDAPALLMLLLTLCVIEEHVQFARLSDEAMAVAGRDGSLVAYLQVASTRAFEQLNCGRLAEATAECEAVAAATAINGWGHTAPAASALLVMALVERGELDEAARVLEASSCDDPRTYPDALLLHARAVFRLAQGDANGALADLLTCGERMERLGVRSPSLLPWRGLAAEAYLLLGVPDEARRLAAEEVDLAGRLSGPVAQANASRVLGLAVGGRPGLDLLHAAAEKVAGSPGALVQARVLTDLGAGLRRSGKVREAREHLAAALDAADACGAAPLARRARDELLAAGGRPRRARQRGPEALTPSELRVARLAAAGATNTVIAQTLFVSRKTVEKHLASAYRKLGVTSRAELDLTALAVRTN